jgi:hypothetical protein
MGCSKRATYILSFKFNKIDIEKNGILVEIIKNNDLNKSSGNKINPL